MSEFQRRDEYNKFSNSFTSKFFLYNSLYKSKFLDSKFSRNAVNADLSMELSNQKFDPRSVKRKKNYKDLPYVLNGCSKLSDKLLFKHENPELFAQERMNNYFRLFKRRRLVFNYKAPLTTRSIVHDSTNLKDNNLKEIRSLNQTEMINRSIMIPSTNSNSSRNRNYVNKLTSKASNSLIRSDGKNSFEFSMITQFNKRKNKQKKLLNIFSKIVENTNEHLKTDKSILKDKNLEHKKFNNFQKIFTILKDISNPDSYTLRKIFNYKKNAIDEDLNNLIIIRTNLEKEMQNPYMETAKIEKQKRIKIKHNK